MASIEFACPHCRGQFHVDSPPAGGQVACPHCHQTLAIPGELPSPGPLVDIEQQEFADRADVDEPAPFVFDPGEVSGPEVISRQCGAPLPADVSMFEPISRQQKDVRRQIRGLAWMIGGIVLLAIAAAVLSRL